MTVIVLGIAAAALLAVGFVLQQHEAARSAGPLLRPRLLLTLVRRPLWLCGIGAMVAGQLLGAAALGLGSLIIVEPLLATNVLFALPLTALWSRRRLGLRDLAGCALLIGGLALLLAGGSPHEWNGREQVAATDWILALAAVSGVVALLVTVAKRGDLGEEATLLASAAGLLFGLQDVLTQRSIVQAESSLPGLLTSWHPYALVTIAVAGLVLEQSAFEIAPLAASLPAMTLAEPVCGIGLGMGLLGEALRTNPAALFTGLTGLVATVCGVWLITRSPIVTEPLGRAEPKRLTSPSATET
jgi:drug/metabolite transporter (DMT)-like permease